MAEKLEKSIPWFVILAICIMIVFGVGIVLKEIMADTIAPSAAVGNTAPVVRAVVLNGGVDITVTENTTVSISGTTTVSDNNGYGDIISVTSTLYCNNTTCSSGLTDPNWCYYISTGCATSSCSGVTCDITCTADVWFIAEPTDASGTYPTKAWQMDITAVDTGSNADTGTSTQELNTAFYLDIDTSIGYGFVDPGATSSEQNTHATNTGNYHINVELSGVDMATGSDTIAVGRQKYSSSSNMGNWIGTALTGTPAVYNLDLPKPTATTSNSYDELYWMIKIPTSPTHAGTYIGTNTISAVWASS